MVYLKYINKSLEYLKKENIINFNKDTISKLMETYDNIDEKEILKQINKNMK